MSADIGFVKITYKALWQSIIGNCITVWGGAGKVNMLIKERSQRPVLKKERKRPKNTYPYSL